MPEEVFSPDKQSKHLPPKIWATALVVAGIVVAFLLVAAQYEVWPFQMQNEKENIACIQVITPARNPQTGEIRQFPTPCDVPQGWEVIEPEVIDDTATWQTYRNEEFGFEVRYPPNYLIVESIISNVQKDHFLNNEGNNILTLIYKDNEDAVKSVTINSFLRVNHHPSLSEGGCYAYSIEDNVRRDTLPMNMRQSKIINGINFIEASVVGFYKEGNDSTLETRIYHNYHNRKCYEIQMAGAFTKFDQIFSTFKYVN